VLRVLRILAPNPGVYTLDGTNTWILGADPAAVIDPGPDIAEHLHEVAESAGRVSAVLVTHDHPDHAPGARRFAESVGAPLYAFRLEGAEHLRDGQLVPVGDLEIAALHTPGHTADHLVFHLPEEGAMFTGDTVLGRGTSFIDPPEGDVAHYLRSLQRMRELAPRILYPGHGPVVLRGTEKIQAYLDHRAEREEQVRSAITPGPRTVPQIVSEIYADYPEEVHELAARSVLAHLLKLQAEGGADRKGSGPDAAWSSIAPRACARCGKPVRGRGRYCGSCSVILLQEGAEDPAEDPQGSQTG
jgi:glyoxylase-like metal-dependent hydrolase (beta-lactamase superfamily II)